MDWKPDDQPESSCSCQCSTCPCNEAESAKRNHLERTRSMVMDGIARVEFENEAAALREALSRHQQSFLDLCTELETERNASSTAINEATSMILRLQGEKAESRMEASQFKRFAEEKMAHDQKKIATLEELLFKRDQAMQSLYCEVQAYKHRLLSYGILDQNPSSSEPNTPRGQLDGSPRPTTSAPNFHYPPLRCTLTVPQACDDYAPIEEYNYGEVPRENLHKIEQRICHLEKMPSRVIEKGVVVGPSSSSPRWPRDLMRRKFSSSFDSFGSRSRNFFRGEEFPVAEDLPSAFDQDDEMSDRIYTVRVCDGEDSYASTPRDLGAGPTPTKARTGNGFVFNGLVGRGPQQEELCKLQMRLHALEADRESMRQTLISMSTDKAQTVLLKEIAQMFGKDSASEKKVLQTASSFSIARTSSLLSVIMWITSVLWRNRSTRIKYSFGPSSSNAGLLLLLKKPPLCKRKFISDERSS